MTDQPPRSATGEWRDLRVLVVNTHVGMLLLTAVRTLVKSFRPHVVLLQEVQSPLARSRLPLVFWPQRWSLTGVMPPSTSRSGSGTIVALRRDRLKRTAHVSMLVTRFRDRFHPERRLTYADAIDRRTHHAIRVCSMHLWAGAGLPEHETQRRVYERAVQDAHRQLMIALFGGDVNEKMNDAETQIELAMKRQHMTAARISGLDGLWVSDASDVQVVSSTAVSMLKWRGGEKHHRALLVTLRLRVLTAQPVDGDT